MALPVEARIKEPFFEGNSANPHSKENKAVSGVAKLYQDRKYVHSK